MARNRLTDKQWNVIKDVFPEPASTGRPPVCRRMVMDGILWINRTGSPWIDEHLIDLGIIPVIPSKSNEDRDLRPVECLFGRMPNRFEGASAKKLANEI